MSMLHTVNKSPFASSTLASCLAHALDGAAVLLIEDGVYGALAAGNFAPTLAAEAQRLRLYVLAPDLAARGFADAALVAGVEMVDYDGFVDLAATNSAVQAWF